MNEKVLMIAFLNGISVPVEGRLADLPPVPGFMVFPHATLGDLIGINFEAVMTVREVFRTDLTMGPNRIINPISGRSN